MKLQHYCLMWLAVGIVACRQTADSRYQQLLAQERNSTKQVNDLFLGISLEMPSKDFYLHCWNMNKQGTFMDGAGNTAVLYKLHKKELRYPADMYFYPEFYQGRIHKMWARFQYEGWAPWNKELNADKLLPDVVNLFRKWYPGGNPFITIEDEKRGTLYVKIDGNRRIIIGKYDDVQVKADFADLRVEDAAPAN